MGALWVAAVADRPRHSDVVGSGSNWQEQYDCVPWACDRAARWLEMNGAKFGELGRDGRCWARLASRGANGRAHSARMKKLESSPG